MLGELRNEQCCVLDPEDHRRVQVPSNVQSALRRARNGKMFRQGNGDTIIV